MENINFNFEKFIKDLSLSEEKAKEKKVTLKKQDNAWSARRLLDRLYRETPHNRIRIKR